MQPPPVSLVTGANGFLGRHLVRRLVAHGHRVVAFDRAFEPNRRPGLDGVSFVEGDVRDRAALASAARGCDALFHLASVVHVARTHEDALHAVNVGGTDNAIAACREAGVPRLVYASSASVVYEGRDIENGTEALPYARRFYAPYARTKRIAEERLLLANGPDLATCALRPHVIFGPGDVRLLPSLVAHARRGIPVVVGDESKRSDFTYVENCAEALRLAALALSPGSVAAGRAYFVTNGEPRPQWAFFRDLLARLGLPGPRFTLPYGVAYAAAAANELAKRLAGGAAGEGTFTRFTVRYLSTHHYFSHARATADLGYHPIVTLDEGIRRTAESFRNRESPAV